MPNDPGQPRVSTRVAERLRRDQFDEIQQWLTWCKAKAEPYVINGEAIREEHKTFLMYGFIAATGLHPTECQLVERREDDEIIWTFEKRTSLPTTLVSILKEKDVQLSQKDAEILALQQRLLNAQTTIAILKGKP